MQINTEVYGDVIVAHTPDEFNEEASFGFARALKMSMDAGRTRFVAQMDRTEILDSAAMETLLDLQDQVRELGGNLIICGLSDTGKKVFEMTRLDQHFDVFENVVEAVANLQ